MSNVNDLNRNLDKMITYVGNMLDVLEKNGRYNSPKTLFFPDYDDDDEYNIDYEELTTREREEAKNRIIAQYQKAVIDLKKELKAKKTKLNNLTRKSTRKARELKKECDRLTSELDDAIREADEASKDWVTKYKSGERYSDQSIDKRWKNASAKTRRNFKTKEKYVKAQKFEQKFKKRTKRRQKASDLLVRSGLGHTQFGQFMQSAIGLRQSIDNAKMFKFQMQGGGGEDMAKAFGVEGAAAQKSVGKLATSAADVSSKLEILKIILSGLMMVTKLFGKIVADQVKYQRQEIEVENEVLQAQYDLQESLVDTVAQEQVAKINAQGALKVRRLDVAGENMLGALRIDVAQYAKAHEIAANAMFNGISDVAYEAAEASFTAAAEMSKYGVQRQQRGKTLSKQEVVTGLEMAAASNVAGAQMVSTLENYYATNAKAALTQNSVKEQNLIHRRKSIGDIIEYGLSKIAGSKTFEKMKQSYQQSKNNEEYKPIVVDKYSKQTKQLSDFEAASERFTESYSKVLDLREKNLELSTVENTRGSSLAVQETQYNSQLQIAAAQASMQATEKMAGYETQRSQVLSDAALRILKAWLALAKNVEQNIRVHDKETNDAGISLGFFNKETLHNYKRAMFDTILDVASNFGMEITEVTKQQKLYIETTGRNKLLTNKDYGSLLGMGHALGDATLATQFGAELEIFNYSVNDSMVVLSNFMTGVNNVGLNFKEYTKDVVKNIKLAHKYNFGNGVKGLMEFVKWSTQTSFNIKEIDSLISKVQTFDLQDVINLSANLGILGGRAAINSDPISMFYEGWNDASAYAKRIQDITKDLGRINPKNGETFFTVAESMFITQVAKLTGRSIESLFDEIRRRNRLEAITNELKDSKYSTWTDKYKQNVANRAFYDNQKQGWYVKVRTPKTDEASGKTYYAFEDKPVSDLNPENSNDFIMSSFIEGRIMEHMQTILDFSTILASVEIKQRADCSAANYETYLEEMTTRTEQAWANYELHRQEYITNAKTNIEFMTKSFKNYVELWKQGNEAIDRKVAKIGDIAGNLNNTLDGLKADADAAMGKLNALANVDFTSGVHLEEHAPPVDNASSTLRGGDVILETGRIYHNSDSHVGDSRGDTSEDLTYYTNKKVFEAMQRAGVFDRYTTMIRFTPYHLRSTNQQGREESIFSGDVYTYVITDEGVAWWKNYVAEHPEYADDGFIPNQGASLLMYAEQVQSFDGNASQNKIVQFAENDSFLAARPGGEIDKYFKSNLIKLRELENKISPNNKRRKSKLQPSLNSTVVFHGTIDLECDDLSIDLLQYIKDNPSIMNYFAKTITEQMTKSVT